MKKDLLEGLTEEQIAKAKACKNAKEILAIAQEEGIELTEEQLEAISGGSCGASDNVCPNCGCNSCNCSKKEKLPNGLTRYTYFCWACNSHYYHDC